MDLKADNITPLHGLTGCSPIKGRSTRLRFQTEPAAKVGQVNKAAELFFTTQKGSKCDKNITHCSWLYGRASRCFPKGAQHKHTHVSAALPL